MEKEKSKLPPIELKFRKWVSKVSERLLFIELNIKEKRGLSESDYDLWKALHDYIWHPGVYPIYVHENLNIKPDETAEQKSLFSQNDVPLINGTELVNLPETLKEEDI